jgi:hypothetical protein
MFVQARGRLAEAFAREFLLAFQDILVAKSWALHTFANSFLSIGIHVCRSVI